MNYIYIKFFWIRKCHTTWGNIVTQNCPFFTKYSGLISTTIDLDQGHLLNYSVDQICPINWGLSSTHGQEQDHFNAETKTRIQTKTSAKYPSSYAQGHTAKVNQFDRMTLHRNSVRLQVSTALPRKLHAKRHSQHLQQQTIHGRKSLPDILLKKFSKQDLKQARPLIIQISQVWLHHTESWHDYSAQFCQIICLALRKGETPRLMVFH